MHVGLRLPLGPDIAEHAEIGQRAESAGFESVWVGDHLVWPLTISSAYPYSAAGALPLPSDTPFFDCLMVLARIGAVTSRLRLCTGVYVLPLRPAVITASAAATVDSISGGRLTLGIGVGWLKEEFAAAGAPFAHHAARTDEIITALRALWGEGPASFAGEHVVVPPLYLEPRPPQGSALPIHVGGESAAALRHAARLGDGWVGMGQSPDSAALIVEQLAHLRAEAGRSSAFETTVLAPWPAPLKVLDHYRASGVDRVLVNPWRGRPWRDGLADAESAIEEIGDRLQ